MSKFYVNDFVEDLNYKNVVLYVDDTVDLDALHDKMVSDNMNHMYHFDVIREDRLFYVENCDLEDVVLASSWNQLRDLIEDEYTIVQLKQDDGGFYIELPDIFENLKKEGMNSGSPIQRANSEIRCCG